VLGRLALGGFACSRLLRRLQRLFGRRDLGGGGSRLSRRSRDLGLHVGLSAGEAPLPERLDEGYESLASLAR
jgi:hypothetical protein